jgi:hypothetical protein
MPKVLILFKNIMKMRCRKPVTSSNILAVNLRLASSLILNLVVRVCWWKINASQEMIVEYRTIQTWIREEVKHLSSAAIEDVHLILRIEEDIWLSYAQVKTLVEPARGLASTSMKDFTMRIREQRRIITLLRTILKLISKGILLEAHRILEMINKIECDQPLSCRHHSFKNSWTAPKCLVSLSKKASRQFNQTFRKES